MKVGLALSGGGVKGCAHIALLKAIDDLGITLHHISGTSMGAILGSLYATGLSGAEIEQRLLAHIVTPDSPRLKQFFKKRRALKAWFSAFSLSDNTDSLIDCSGLFSRVFPEIITAEFHKLTTQLSICATDFETGDATYFDRGEIYSAVCASMAIPGVFPLVTIDQHRYADGGLSENLPTRALQDCDIIIASDVISTQYRVQAPSKTKAVNQAISILLAALNKQQPQLKAPSLTISFPTENIDFLKITDIYPALQCGKAHIEKNIDALKHIQVLQANNKNP